MLLNSEISPGFVRLIKVRNAPAWPYENEVRREPVGAQTLAHPIFPGYVVDGWFLEGPMLGREMVFLRFRRNEIHRLGVFISSTVVFIAEHEVRTLNSVYRIEHHPFEILEAK